MLYDTWMITREAFTDAMKLAVLAKGEDYVYPFRDTGDAEPSILPGMNYTPVGSGCDYRRNGEPSCLIGYTLDILGIRTTSGDEEKDASVVLAHYGIVDSLLRIAAVAAQETQDLGGTWGEALSVYLDNVTPEKISEEQVRIRTSKSLVARLAERIAQGRKG